MSVVVNSKGFLVGWVYATKGGFFRGSRSDRTGLTTLVAFASALDAAAYVVTGDTMGVLGR